MSKETVETMVVEETIQETRDAKLELTDNVEYEVEKIVGHRVYKSKVVKYEVKWKGYPEEDNTTEAANTLHDDVPELCIAYWESQTDIPLPNNVPKRQEVVEYNPKKRSSSEETSVSKKSKKNGLEHVPKYMVKLGYAFPTNNFPNKKTNWNQQVKKICVQASPKDPKLILTYIEWNNEEKTIHEMEEVHQKIPEKLIAYYEERLQFI